MPPFRAPGQARSAQFNLLPLPDNPSAMHRSRTGVSRATWARAAADASPSRSVSGHAVKDPWFEGTKKPIGRSHRDRLESLSAALARSGPRSYPTRPGGVNPILEKFSEFFRGGGIGRLENDRGADDGINRGSSGNTGVRESACPTSSTVFDLVATAIFDRLIRCRNSSECNRSA